MRELKFRAWNRDGMTDCFCIHSQGLVAFGHDWLDDKDKPVVMQYTGLKDTHGKEIYEGDIISIPGDYCGDHYYKTSIGIIEYQAPEFYPTNPNDKDGVTWQDVYWEQCEVIGNIYENPELLENM